MTPNINCVGYGAVGDMVIEGVTVGMTATANCSMLSIVLQKID